MLDSNDLNEMFIRDKRLYLTERILISELDIPSRTKRLFEKKQILTLADLLSIPYENYEIIPDLGLTSAKQLLDYLNESNLDRKRIINNELEDTSLTDSLYKIRLTLGTMMTLKSLGFKNINTMKNRDIITTTNHSELKELYQCEKNVYLKGYNSIINEVYDYLNEHSENVNQEKEYLKIKR